jgi:hypothetical protein
MVYTKPWMPRNKLPLRLMPNGSDLVEMITAPSDVAAYKRVIASQTTPR